MGVAKRTYHLLAILALVHALLLMGGLGYLVASKKLDAEKVRSLVDLIRDVPADDEVETESASSVNPADAIDARSVLQADATEEELERRTLEREYMQANHRLILANRQMTEVRRRQEEFEKWKAEFAVQRKKQVEDETREGFQRDLEIVSMLKPKVALDSLLSRPVDDAARLLLEMEPRKSKKIFEVANKKPSQWAKILKIQERLRNLASVSDPQSGNDAKSSSRNR